MRATEQQCIDLGFANRGQQSFGEQSHFGATRSTTLHEFHEARTRRTREIDGGAVRRAGDREFVSPRVDGADGADDPHRSRSRGPHQGLRTRIDHTDDRNVQTLGGELGLEFVHREGGRRGVARDHQGFRAEVVDQAPGKFTGVTANFVERLVAEGIAAGVADVHEVFAGEEVNDGSGHRESSETGVEHADRAVESGCHALHATAFAGLGIVGGRLWGLGPARHTTELSDDGAESFVMRTEDPLVLVDCTGLLQG